VRELKNVIERALILEKSDQVQAGSLPDFRLETQLHRRSAPKNTGNQSLDELLAEFERELIGEMLERNHFSLTKTAEQLKLSRHALRYRMQRLNISMTTDEDEEKAMSAGNEDST
jgi:transcriptional regulator with PAS, ATPase and Fis domain